VQQEKSVWTAQLMCHATVLFLCWFTATLTYYGLGFSAGDMAVRYCELHNNRPKTAETSAIRVS